MYAIVPLDDAWEGLLDNRCQVGELAGHGELAIGLWLRGLRGMYRCSAPGVFLLNFHVSTFWPGRRCTMATLAGIPTSHSVYGLQSAVHSSQSIPR